MFFISSVIYYWIILYHVAPLCSHIISSRIQYLVIIKRKHYYVGLLGSSIGVPRTSVFIKIQHIGAVLKECISLTLILLKWRIGWDPNNARKGQMGFNSEFKELRCANVQTLREPCIQYSWLIWPQSWESPVEIWWHTVTHWRVSEGETSEWSR
jgi:hypothetical protein